MADGKTITHNMFQFYIEDPATPDVFVKACGFLNRDLNRSKAASENVTVDCDDDDLPGAVERGVISEDWSVSGEGVLVEQSFALLDKFFASGVPWRVRVERTFPAPTGLVKDIGPAIMTTFSNRSERGGKVTMQMEISGAGRFVRIP